MQAHEMLNALDGALHSYLPEVTEDTPQAGQIPKTLRDAMAYCLLHSGKRLRPLLLLQTVHMLGGELAPAMPLACALEMLHTYSLIHDDLPCMDDDDLRRGRPTCHKVFGEAQAMLAGDGLQSLAYEVMLEGAQGCAYPMGYLRAMLEISTASGVRGMVGGQCVDLLCEGKDDHQETTEEELRYIHQHKTGKLLSAPLRAGGFLCGAGLQEMEALTSFGENFGLAFQITDDLLDVLGQTSTMGKPVGSDAKKQKMTYVSLYGVQGAQQRAHEAATKAAQSLSHFGTRSAWFQDLAQGLLTRQK